MRDVRVSAFNRAHLLREIGEALLQGLLHEVSKYVKWKNQKYFQFSLLILVKLWNTIPVDLRWLAAYVCENRLKDTRIIIT